MPRKTQRVKADAIRRILDNPTYMPESGMYLSAAKALAKLPLGAVNSIAIIVSMKAPGATK